MQVILYGNSSSYRDKLVCQLMVLRVIAEVPVRPEWDKQRVLTC